MSVEAFEHAFADVMVLDSYCHLHSGNDGGWEAKEKEKESSGLCFCGV